MPRYLAERAGLIPVTVVRQLRAFVNPGPVAPPTWLPLREYERARLFLSDRYLPAIQADWVGVRLVKDGYGRDAVAFWPQHLGRRSHDRPSV